MMYKATIRTEGSNLLAEFPDCPGCLTFATPGEDIGEQARDAIEGWLRAHIIDDETPPRPFARPKCPRGARLAGVDISPALGIKLALRWAREDAGLTRAQVARRAGVTVTQVAQIERHWADSTIDIIEKVAAAVGMRVEVGSATSASGIW